MIENSRCDNESLSYFSMNKKNASQLENIPMAKSSIFFRYLYLEIVLLILEWVMLFTSSDDDNYDMTLNNTIFIILWYITFQINWWSFIMVIDSIIFQELKWFNESLYVFLNYRLWENHDIKILGIKNVCIIVRLFCWSYSFVKSKLQFPWNLH